MNWNKPTLKGMNMIVITLIIIFYILYASFGRVHWSADVLATFLDYALLLLIILVGWLVWTNQWGMATLGLIAVLWGGFDLINFPLTPLKLSHPTEMRLMVFNVYFQNTGIEAVMAEIKRHDPDLIYLMEYPSNANPTMRLDLAADYPYQIIEPSRFTMGTALFSKFPIVRSEVHQFAGTRIPITEAVIDVNGEHLTFVGGHPWPPLPQWGQLHREQLDDVIGVAAAVDETQMPLIVAGDFNTPPTAYMLNKLAAEANVRQVRQRFDFRKTYFPYPLVAMSLDHVFVSDKIWVGGYFFGNSAGSDHVPLVVDFSLAP
ncbi:MAG: endonuclease/exonuclease/phosphatase family protein [Chloroflexota bacterium]